MRVIELEIHNVRGIPHLLVKPEGRNLVIWGPNGSGKSAVVDAIDFLLTGRISRLTGTGTGDISLSKHGPHIDCQPKEAKVRAAVQLPGIKDPIEIRRCMARPNKLECDKTVISKIVPVMALALRGQHVLTRREILKYITAEARTRAQEIQELLNITEIEEIRKALVNVRNTFDKEVQAAKRELETARGAVNATVREKIFDEEAVLRTVNQNRGVLGGKPISSLSSADLKKGAKAPTVVSSDKGINVTLLERDIQNLSDVTLEANQGQIAESEKELRDLIITIRSDPQLLRALARIRLTKLGLELIDDTADCPLCDTPWPPGKLREYLEERLSVAETANKQQARITELSSSIVIHANNTIASLEKVLAAMETVGLKDNMLVLQSWFGDLRELLIVLETPVDKYPAPRFESEWVKRMLAPTDIIQTLSDIQSAFKTKFPEATPEQNAWDTLTRLEENLKRLETAMDSFKNVKLSQKRAKTLLASFLISRDKVLGKLYDDVKDKFVDFYRQLHGLDEGGFAAKIQPEEAGLNLEVDFYGRGTHPPHALHSEGHQDSMGISLYLALAERLTKGVIDLVILDDVVMSVDSDHRRHLCRVLSNSFPHRQFLITTHDKTWSNQLKSEGIVSTKDTIEFYNWNIDTGPQINYGVDMWKRIEEDMVKNDVPSASAKLRRGSEDFFGTVCDNLQARVKYRLDGRWELGDFLPAAMGRFRALIKKAKTAAHSWDDKELFDRLQELDSTVGPIYTRSNAEQWAINANLHYNNWANFSPNDFGPLVEAFQDLFGLFICVKCGGILHLTIKGIKPEAVRCSCGKVNWNLVEKPKE